MQRISFAPRFAAWRAAARRCLALHLPPDSIVWAPDAAAASEGIQASLFPAMQLPAATAAEAQAERFEVSPIFLRRARLVSVHQAADVWELLYRLLWRLTHGERHLLEVAVDGDTGRFARYQAQVKRDIHKCHAFVRFREIDGRYIAWYRPDHAILRLAAPHFVARFRNMQWSILSDQASIHWDEHKLAERPGCPMSAAPQQDEMEDLWRTYYAAIFNPARLKVRAMRQEMPRRFWAALPESRLIDGLIADAPARLATFRESQARSALASVPPASASWEELQSAAQACRVCAWCTQSTQTVFGEGPRPAPLALVGEQPGDQEDNAGRPFVGPAGDVLTRALAAAEVPRDAVYLTNAVKHFKWERREKLRLHKRPAARDISACRPWLVAEMKRVRPVVLVCLGGTAAQAVLGRAVQVRAEVGQIHPSSLCSLTLITAHPAAILRADPSTQQRDFAALTHALGAARKLALASAPTASLELARAAMLR